MKPIRIARSFVAADSLAEVIAEEYDLAAPISCKLFSKLLRTQDNDHYLVTTGDGQQVVARVYQQGDRLKRQESDYLYELDWLNFLNARNLPVSYPIVRRDGGFLGRLLAPEGLRYYALFSLAKGEPMSLKDVDQLYACGESIATIHVASNDYSSTHARRALDLTYLLDEPLERIKRNWSDEQSENLDLILTSADEARDELEALFRNEQHIPDGWGPIGGDFHDSSVYFDKNNRPAFFNFDLCGPGWRAYDIASFLLNTNLIHASEEHSEAFFAGYYSVRSLSENEHAAISPFLTIRRIWLMGAFARADGLVGHTFVGSI
jgi:Ser/Thr protein kinase RdoA (MazF antagonist)